jgi:hypothetical protein
VPEATVPDNPNAPITEPELEKLIGGPPTTVTFSGQSVPVRDIVAAMRQAVTRPLDANPMTLSTAPLDKTFSVDWKEVPFWKAAAQVEAMTLWRWINARKGGLELGPFGTFGGALNGVVAAQTPYFLLIGQSVTRSSVLELAMNDDEKARTNGASLLVKFRSYTDPKVPVAKTSLSNCRFQLEENGPWVKLYDPTSLFNSQATITELTLNLPSELKPGTVISSLTGTYNIELVRETQTWNVPDLLATPTASETIAGTKLRLEDAKFDGDDFKVTVAYPAPEKGGAAFKDLAESVLTLKLTDSAGNLLGTPLPKINLGKAVDGIVDVKTALTFSSTKTGEPIAKGPISLAWTLPLLSRSVEIPFELKGVKVP